MKSPIVTPLINAINARDLDNAIKKSATRLNKLKHLEPIYQSSAGASGKELIVSAAGFSSVYKVKDQRQQKFYALKCFHVIKNDRKERYTKISGFLSAKRPNWMAEFSYHDAELSVVPTGAKQDILYPVLTMEWIDGPTLGAKLAKLCETQDKKQLHELSIKWAILAQQLLSSGIAHGDLKPDNIMLRSSGKNELVLVDYDSMYVPSLAGYQAADGGGESFQHPKNSFAKFDEKIDSFSMLVLSINMRAISLNPNISSGPLDEANLLFRAVDFIDPIKSRIFAALFSLSDPWLTDAMKILRTSCQSSSTQIPNLTQVLTGLASASAPAIATRKTIYQQSSTANVYKPANPMHLTPKSFLNIKTGKSTRVPKIIYPVQNAGGSSGNNSKINSSRFGIGPFAIFVILILAVSWMFSSQNGEGTKIQNVETGGGPNATEPPEVERKKGEDRMAEQEFQEEVVTAPLSDKPIDYAIDVPMQGFSATLLVPTDKCIKVLNETSVSAFVVFSDQIFKFVKGGPSPNVIFKSKTGKAETAHLQMASKKSHLCQHNE